MTNCNPRICEKACVEIVQDLVNTARAQGYISTHCLLVGLTAIIRADADMNGIDSAKYLAAVSLTAVMELIERTIASMEAEESSHVPS